MKSICFLFFVLIIDQQLPAQKPSVSSGKLIIYDSFPSAFVQPRTVAIWLPPGYNYSRNYDVLYMQDGQMLFDSTTSWNKQEWKVDETMTSLLKQHKIRPTIVVAIWNNGKYRHAEYFPQKPLNNLPSDLRDSVIHSALLDKPLADRYLLFLVKELMPFINRRFTAWKSRQHTFIAGSSMGALISLYALCRYPERFGGAACLSTHWPGVLPPGNERIPNAFITYFARHLPQSSTHKIYFDYGTKTLDSFYGKWQIKLNSILKRKGYSSQNGFTCKFEGADHSEHAWSERLMIPLQFLLKP